jgi:hypothetical protein
MPISAGRRGLDVIVTPDMRKVRRDIRKVDRDFPRALGRVHKRLGEIPAEEAKRRARRRGGGYVRLARDIRPRANSNDVRVVIGGKRFPDSIGWEFGALQYPQFDRWTGRGENAGYVVFALKRDRAWVDDFAARYARELSEFLDPILY